METGIAAEKLADLASEYFGVKLEEKDGVRLISFPGGSKGEPDPLFKLRSCKRNVSGIFQGLLHTAVCTAPICQREDKEACNCTQGILLIISNRGERSGQTGRLFRSVASIETENAVVWVISLPP
jgi:hypothetical protein